MTFFFRPMVFTAMTFGLATAAVAQDASSAVATADDASCATAAVARPNVIAVKTMGRKKNVMLDRPLG